MKPYKSLDIGKVYMVESPDYGLCSIKGQYIKTNMIRGDLFLVLDLINDNLQDDVEYFCHYKILYNGKIGYIVVVKPHPQLENYLKELYEHS